MILPVAKETAPREPQPAMIPRRSLRITGFGARGNGKWLDTEPFHAAIHACWKAGGGRMIVPTGIQNGPAAKEIQMPAVGFT